MVTKTYLPSNLCDGSDSSDTCDSSDSSDSSGSGDSSDRKKRNFFSIFFFIYFFYKKISQKNSKIQVVMKSSSNCDKTPKHKL